MNHRRVLRLGATLTSALILGSMLSAPAQATSTTGMVGGIVHLSGESTIPTNAVIVAIWPASSAPVTLHDEPPKFKPVNADGHYRLTGIKPGKYIVGAVEGSGAWDYGFFKSATLSSKAKTITVTAGHIVGAINITLDHAATIAATVKSSANEGLSGITVTAYDADGVEAGYNADETSDGSGGLQVVGLPAGTYRFKLSGTGIPTQWADGINTFSAAKAVKVSSSQALTGVVLTAQANAAIPSTVKPKITGTLKKGHTLTTTNGGWATPPTSFVYRWLRNGKAITGATAKTYKLGQADVGRHISVRVGAVKPDYVTNTRTSSITAKITQ
ncbi:MAG: hypothetical protein JWR83_2594 [Aeromicrobium sp.]|nr:hypothetical protein [Aeromicrobium sp.]